MTKISRTALMQKLEETRGKIVSVTFIKTDKTTRKMTGVLKPGKPTKLGYVLFKEFGETVAKSFDPRTLTNAAICGVRYVVK